METTDLIREAAVLVHKKTEASLLLQQSLAAAVSNKLLHVHLTVSESLYTLQEREREVTMALSTVRQMNMRM